MALLFRQTWALVRKNLLIICVRRPFLTFIRAIAIPLAVVFIAAYSKYFFSSPQKWGVSSSHAIRSLQESLAASDGHDIVGFVDNDMKWEVSAVIESLSQTIDKAGKTATVFSDSDSLAKVCASDISGISPCYAAVVFHSSPSQGTSQSLKGAWNYTIRADGTSYGGLVDVTNDKNAAEIYLMPLQLALDREIISQSAPETASRLPQKLNAVLFTADGPESQDKDMSSSYLALCVYVFGAVFAFSMIGIVYHISAFVASERELGMSSLIDTMVPGDSSSRGRLIRQLSTYISFVLVYLPGWLAVGIILSVVVFPKTSHGIPVAYNVFSGLAFTSYSLYFASHFKKSQLSGSIAVIINLVFAVFPQVLSNQNQILVIVLSLLFPSANYTYFITGMALWEQAEVSVDITKDAPDSPLWRVKLCFHFIFLIVQIIVYPLLAFSKERSKFDTTSKNRKFEKPVSPEYCCSSKGTKWQPKVM